MFFLNILNSVLKRKRKNIKRNGKGCSLLDQAKAGILADREQERVRKQLKSQMTDENARLASEQQSL